MQVLNFEESDQVSDRANEWLDTRQAYKHLGISARELVGDRTTTIRALKELFA